MDIKQYVVVSSIQYSSINRIANALLVKFIVETPILVLKKVTKVVSALLLLN